MTEKTVDRWSWDRESIKRYRETHEPYDKHEEIMMEHFMTNSSFLDMWMSSGEIERETLPSGLIILTKRGKDHKGKNYMEKVVFTDEMRILDFQHWPKEQPQHKKMTREEFERKAEQLIKKLKEKKVST